MNIFQNISFDWLLTRPSRIRSATAPGKEKYILLAHGPFSFFKSLNIGACVFLLSL
jgi:hypothetical protein